MNESGCLAVPCHRRFRSTPSNLIRIIEIHRNSKLLRNDFSGSPQIDFKSFSGIGRLPFLPVFARLPLIKHADSKEKLKVNFHIHLLLMLPGALRGDVLNFQSGDLCFHPSIIRLVAGAAAVTTHGMLGGVWCGTFETRCFGARGISFNIHHPACMLPASSVHASIAHPQDSFPQVDKCNSCWLTMSPPPPPPARKSASVSPVSPRARLC